MNLAAVEAINRVNESVTVEMLVQKTKRCSGSRQVFLDSEANHRDPKNLGVVVTESGRAKFSEAHYLRDPDGIGVELYWDRPQETWPRTPLGELAMYTRRLDLNGLLKLVEADTSAPALDEGPRDL